MIVLLLFLFQNGYAYQFPIASQQLNCNRIIGNWNDRTVLFSRPIDSITAVDSAGPVVINWIEMECANPPFTTRRPSPPGHGHGGNHHHHYSGSSSDESC
uniref:ZP domain-containing protein n=1 Tax=Caenorhabditis tropicalis TaxID=1561998 RepID=A0A1I7UGB0_9PELO